MAKYNVGDRVRILAETEALRSLWGKTGTVEASSEQYFGAVYAVSYTHLTLPTSDLV